ncbi:prephenate dehydratase [Zhouia sp. PK063]|uniref:prephenate dehydratase n=1 Tax=Zhouia sp. PK063 TaxID=3373602 RepID=UPI0037B3731E
MDNKVAIQGVLGSFHHQVVKDYFAEQQQVVECATFDTLVNSLLDKTSDRAVMAIENSIAGSIIPNYALINANNLHIIGEYYLNVNHNLMALPGQSIEDITEVYSHHMALLQCKVFFKQYPHIKLIEDTDTADVAKRIQQKQLKGVGAIASVTAAELYELTILSHSIQTIKSNETRFVIVQTQNSAIPQNEINKASVMFELGSKRGSLATVLNVMSDCKLNLTKIQSLPKIETPWKYSFYVDVTFENYSDFEKAKSLLAIMAEEFKVHGEYKNAKL